MSLATFTADMRPAIEAELKRNLAFIDQPGIAEYTRMLAYHMGWEGDGAGERAQGKRVRPLFLLLTNAAGGINR